MNLPKVQQLCILCGYCCKIIRVDPSPEFDELVKVRGTNTEPNGSVLVEMPCQHLTDRGCGIYEQRPQMCKDRKVNLSNHICYKGIQEIIKEKLDNGKL